MSDNDFSDSDRHSTIVEPPKELPEGLDWFEHRLQGAVDGGGANFRDPIDWQKYGPLFLELYKVGVEHKKGGYLTSGPLEQVLKKLEEQFEWDVRR